MVIVKKYSNRRLYDTELSRYVTLEELAERIRDGADVRVVDAKRNTDLTQSVLAQIILESRGASKLLPTSFLVQLIRMGDEDIAFFMGRYLSWALEMYQQAKRASGRFGPLAQAPFAATGALARLWQGQAPWATRPPTYDELAPPMPPVDLPDEEEPGREEPTTRQELEALRGEIAELRNVLGLGRARALGLVGADDGDAAE